MNIVYTVLLNNVHFDHVTIITYVQSSTPKFSKSVQRSLQSNYYDSHELLFANKLITCLSVSIISNYWTWKLIWNYVGWLLWNYFNSNLSFDKKIKEIPGAFERSVTSRIFNFQIFIWKLTRQSQWKSQRDALTHWEKNRISLEFKLQIMNKSRRKERSVDFANFAALYSKHQETKVKLIYQRTKAWQKLRRNRGASQETTFHQSTTTKWLSFSNQQSMVRNKDLSLELQFRSRLKSRPFCISTCNCV